jgi:hypothetical protein
MDAMNKTLLEGMSCFRDPLRETDQTGMNFLLTDLDVALAFMDIAANAPGQETRRRNRDNACKAYAEVVQRLDEQLLETPQRQEVEAKLAIVKARLLAIGATP